MIIIPIHENSIQILAVTVFQAPEARRWYCPLEEEEEGLDRNAIA